MAPELIADIVKTKFGDAVVDVVVSGGHPSIAIAAEKWHEVAKFLRDDSRLQLNFLRCVSGVDWKDKGRIEVIYDLMSVRPAGPGQLWVGDNVIAYRVGVPRDGGHVPSVADLWPTADWHEREAFDMFGVVFDGHPDLRRILCPEDWVGHPLRKDYEFPSEYHGIPATVESGRPGQ